MPKRNVVVFGNCQSALIANILQQSDSVSANYNIFHHFTAHNEEERKSWLTQAESAELFLVQDIANWNDYPFREFADRSRTIKFPFLYFAALWPFDAHQGRGDPVAVVENSRLPDRVAFAYQDSLLARLRSEIADPEDRFRAYRDFTFRRPIDVRRLADAERLRLVVMDEKYQTSIGQYIIDQCKQRCLFHTVTHPTLDLTIELTRLLCASAGLEFKLDNAGLHDAQGWYQVPLHPRVILDLGIGWATDETRYNFRDRKITFDMYYRAYIFLYG